jgi:hypothetical protein
MAFAGKTEEWLHQVLTKRNSTVSDTWLLTVDGSDHILWYPREDAK